MVVEKPCNEGMLLSSFDYVIIKLRKMLFLMLLYGMDKELLNSFMKNNNVERKNG